MNHRFQFSQQAKKEGLMQAFNQACAEIERDANFQPDITNQELLSLVRNADGTARHAPSRSALAIGKSRVEQAGVVYPVRIARKGLRENEEYPVWHIDYSVSILVNPHGELSLHATDKATENNFSEPLTRLSAEDFLNRDSLQPQGQMSHSRRK